MKRAPGWSFDIGDEMSLPSYIGIILINHEIGIPIKQAVIISWKVRGVFFFSWLTSFSTLQAGNFATQPSVLQVGLVVQQP